MVMKWGGWTEKDDADLRRWHGQDKYPGEMAFFMDGRHPINDVVARLKLLGLWDAERVSPADAARRWLRHEVNEAREQIAQVERGEISWPK
jgi:hypothetical protein